MVSEVIKPETIERFEELTSYNITLFLSNYVLFVDVEYGNIVNYYSGISKSNPTKSLNSLNWLIDEQKKIIDVFILNSSSFDNYQFWTLLEYIEDIGSTLQTADNSSKWLRSTITKDGYKQLIETEYVARQGESIEDIERNVLASSDSQESWVDTALRNELNEEDYTLEGGYFLKVTYKNNSGITIQSVVDNINTSDKTYGLDIQKDLLFENNDLKVLGYRDTILQAANIYVNLLKGDNPTFPNDGIDKKMIIGSAIAAVSYPVIFRQLASLYAKDDRFKEFMIQNVRRDKDAIFIDFQVKTRAKEVISETVII